MVGFHEVCLETRKQPRQETVVYKEEIVVRKEIELVVVTGIGIGQGETEDVEYEKEYGGKFYYRHKLSDKLHKTGQHFFVKTEQYHEDYYMKRY